MGNCKYRGTFPRLKFTVISIRFAIRIIYAKRSAYHIAYLSSLLPKTWIDTESKKKKKKKKKPSISIQQGESVFRTGALIIVTAKIYLANWKRHRCVNHRVYTNNIHGSRETCFHESNARWMRPCKLKPPPRGAASSFFFLRKNDTEPVIA